MKTCRSNKKSGFSLLELLAVVTILGIIASIIVPRVTVSNQNAKDQVQKHQIATLNAAVERFYVNTGAFPATIAAMGTDYIPDGVPTPPNSTVAAPLTYSLDANDRVIAN